MNWLVVVWCVGEEGEGEDGGCGEWYAGDAFEAA